MIPAHFTVAKNLVLAEIPFFLSIYLFVIAKHRTFWWWVLCAVFIAFLPNAAYVLTDIIHFVGAVQEGKHSLWYLVLVLFPIYIFYIALNFQFYVISVMLAQRYIIKEGYSTLGKWFTPAIHFLCAIGVYLGRIERLNSQNLFEKPIMVVKDVIGDLTHLSSFALILLFFALFYGLYLLFAHFNMRIWNKKLAKYWQAIQAVKEQQKGNAQ